MLSLFPPDKNRNAEKEKKKESFNLDSFINEIIPIYQDSEKEDAKKIQTIEYNERAEHVPSKTAVKIMQDVQRKYNESCLPPDLRKASKKISKSINNLILNAPETKSPGFAGARKRIIEPVQPIKKPPLQNSKPSSSQTFNKDPRSKLPVQGANLRPNSMPKRPINEGSSTNSSLKSIPNKSMQEKGINNMVKKPRDMEHSEKMKERTEIKKKNPIAYDPLEYLARPQKEKKGNPKEKEDEQYDPLRATVNLNSATKDPEGLLGKRFNLENESEFETDVIKKVK